MHLPSWLCRAVYRIHPNLRLAWIGRDKPRFDGELNKGSFGLVQLIDAGRIGPLDSPIVYDELWHVSPRVNDAGTVEMTKVDRGPIFNRNGGTTLDYDPITQVPIFVIDLEQLGFSNQQVCDGDFIPALKARWMQPWRQRYEDSKRAKLKDTKDKLKDKAGEASEFLWREANKTGATSPVVPWEFAKEDVKKMYEGKQHRKLESYFK